MAFREVDMWEVLQILRRLGRGESRSAIKRATGADRKTIRNYESIALDLGWNAEACASHSMSGHDPQNTGCSDCPEDVTTGVDDEDQVATTVTRVQFAGAFPNPVSGASTQFRFEVPVRAKASPEVFDVRGRRVRSMLQAEVAAGEHLIGWDGRDGAGRSVASGQYLARLRVQGPGVREDLTRRVTVLR